MILKNFGKALSGNGLFFFVLILTALFSIASLVPCVSAEKMDLTGYWMMTKSVSFGYESKTVGTIYNFKDKNLLELIVQNELFSKLRWKTSDNSLYIEGKEEKYNGPVVFKKKDHILFNYKFHYMDETGAWAQSDGAFEFKKISMPSSDKLVTASLLQAAWRLSNKDKIIFYKNGSVRIISPDNKEKSANWGLAGNLLEVYQGINIKGLVKIIDKNNIQWNGSSANLLSRDLSAPPIFVNGARFSAPDDIYIEATSAKIHLNDKPSVDGNPLTEIMNGDAGQILGVGPKQAFPNIGEYHYYLIKVYDKEPGWIYGAFINKHQECSY